MRPEVMVSTDLNTVSGGIVVIGSRSNECTTCKILGDGVGWRRGDRRGGGQYGGRLIIVEATSAASRMEFYWGLLNEIREHV